MGLVEEEGLVGTVGTSLAIQSEAAGPHPLVLHTPLPQQVRSLGVPHKAMPAVRTCPLPADDLASSAAPKVAGAGTEPLAAQERREERPWSDIVTLNEGLVLFYLRRRWLWWLP